MSKKGEKENHENIMEENKQEVNEVEEQELSSEQVVDEKEEEVGEQKEEGKESDELGKLEAEVQEAKDKYLRLYSEFDNYRRRTAKERLDLINTASEELMRAMLPVIDDFERADKAFDEKGDVKSFKEGYDLIYSKLKNITESKGLKVMECKAGDDFNPEIHEAITQIPAPTEDLKGKVVDVIEKGYFLNEKVIRFAKVVTGA